MKTRHLLLLGCGVAALTLEMPAIAQLVTPATGSDDQAPSTPPAANTTPPPDGTPGRPPAVLEEVQVTGSRWKALQGETLPVTSYTAEDRNLLGIGTARDLVNLTPGFVFTDTYGINVRGVGRQTPQSLLGQENAVIQYVDGFIQLVPSNIAESTLFGGNVQFSRGPQGTLYGRNSLAGAINLVSRAPTKEFHGEAEAGVGRAGFNIEGVNLAGPITDDLGFRIGFERTEAPTLQTNIGPDRGAGFAQRNNYFEFQLEYTKGPFHVRTRTTTFNFDNKPGYTSPAQYNTTTALGGVSPNPQYKYNVASPTDPYKINVDYAGYDKLRNNFQQIVNADLDLGPVGLYYVGGYQQYKSIGSADLDLTSRRSYVAVAPDPFIPGTVVPTFYTSNYENHNHFYSHELRLESKTSGPLQYVVGGYYYNQKFDESYWEAIPDTALLETPTVGAAGGTTAPNPRRATFQQRNLFNIRSIAGFGNIQYAFTPQWVVDTGLRFTKDEKLAHTNFRYVFSYPPLFAGDVTPAVHAADPFERDHGTTGHLSVAWRPTSRIDTYASYARGYQSSAFTLGQGLPPDNIAAPEHLDVYEVGFNARPTDAVTVGGSIFYQNFFDMQIPISTRSIDAQGRPLGPVYSKFVNAGRAKIAGLEAEATWKPTSGSAVTLTYTYLRPTFASFCPPVPSASPPTCGAVDITEPTASQVPENLSGNQVPRAPRNKATLYGYYTIGLGDAGSLIPGASVSYQSKYYASAFQKDKFVVPGRTVSNFSLTYRTRDNRFDLVAGVSNAFAKAYAEDVTVSNIGSNLFITRTLGADRFYSLIGRTRF